MTAISSTSILQSILAQNSSTSSSSTTTDSSTDQSLTSILAQYNGTSTSGSGTSSSSSSGNSYLLDLSPEAQAYLTNMTGSGTSSQGSTTTSTGAGVVLSPVQQDKLNVILEKYKDAPYTDATFQSIQKDMSAAGIGADSLSAKTEMRNLNPTAMLLNALNGGDSSVGTIGGSADIATMETNFMGSVRDQWQNISSDYDKTTDGSKSVEAAAAADTTVGGTSDAS